MRLLPRMLPCASLAPLCIRFRPHPVQLCKPHSEYDEPHDCVANVQVLRRLVTLVKASETPAALVRVAG